MQRAKRQQASERAEATPDLSNEFSLEDRAYRIRRKALRMGEVQGQGYIAQALGIADVLAVSYFHAMRYRPDDPEWEGRDRFLLSIGHYAIALYAALIEAGIIPEDELEINGGSLGHGLALAVGFCLGLKRKKSDAFVYCLFSDGELGEGSIWEGAWSASHHKLDNLIGIVDVNNQQADGPAREVTGFEPLDARFAAFGWHVQRVNGNDIDALVTAFDAARALTEPKPRIVICDTKMAKGIPFLEEREKNHFLRVEPQEWRDALKILDAGRTA